MAEPVVTCAFERLFQAWDYARIEGTLDAGDRRIDSVSLVDADRRPISGGEARLRRVDGSTKTRVTVSCLTDELLKLADCALEVRVAGELQTTLVQLDAHFGDVDATYAPLFSRFRELVAAHPAPRVLEVGGRDRSGVSHRWALGDVAEYVGIDILPGPGADIVGDAHTMSDVLGRERFDFACSYDVWEHLAMPWKAVVELNRVLVDGGHAYIVAPQTCGMHDLPWDFYRYSDSGFRGLFSAETGFAVIDVVRSDPMHVFPFHSRRGHTSDELTAGFVTVAALVRKTGPTQLEWLADPLRVLDAPYPE